jgi:hypothetical protein
MTFIAAKGRSELIVALLDRAAILLPLITIVVFGLGRSPVPSITVAFSKIIIPALFCANLWLGIAVRGV